MHDQVHRNGRYACDAGEVLHRIKTEVLVDVAHRGMAVRGQHQSQAVRLRSRNRYRPRKSWPVFNDDLLAPLLTSILRNHSGQDVGETAGSEWDHDPDCLIWIILGGGKIDSCERTDDSGGHNQQRTTCFHRAVPRKPFPTLTWLKTCGNARTSASR